MLLVKYCKITKRIMSLNLISSTRKCLTKIHFSGEYYNYEGNSQNTQKPNMTILNMNI